MSHRVDASRNSIDDDDDAHELQPLQPQAQTSALLSYQQRRSKGHTVPYSDKAARLSSGSEDYDEDFADETLRLRGPNGSSLDLTRDNKSEEDEEDPSGRRIRLGGRRRRSSVPSLDEAKALSNEPADIVSRVVKETDDPTLPALTFRVIVIGSFFCVLGAGISQLFFFKSNSASFSSYFVILISLPLGNFLARTLPKRRVYLGSWSFHLNPGPFSIKEHLLIGIVSSSGSHSAYASDIITIQELFFNQRMGNVAGLTLLLTTQTLGFGLAGLLHNLLVKPTSMIFPSNLVVTTMFYTLHDRKSSDTRARLFFFAICFIGIFIYQFLPALLMPTLSSIAVLCLFNNSSNTFRVLSSGYKGFGLPNISLDWNAIGASGPLYQPWWAALNFYVGIAAAMYVVMPFVYFRDIWDASKFPSPIDAGLYEGKTFGKFDIASLLKADSTLDRVKFDAEKPVLLTPWFAISYAIAFGTLTSMISHVLLWHRKDVYQALRHPYHDDIHNRLMRAYPGVPRSWYLMLLSVSLSSAVILVYTSPLQLPVWGLLLAVLIALIFLVPVGIIKAVSDTAIGLNVITEFVAGLLLPGQPIANVCFKCYGYMAMAQALDLTTDLKLAHYMKIPPRAMFLSQLLGTVIGCVVNLAVVRMVLNPVNGYRDYITGTKVDPTAQWDGRKVKIFYSASIIWGAIGPKEFFSGKYVNLYWGFLLGAAAPFVPFLLNKRWPRSYWQLVNFPVMLHGAGAPPQIPTNIIMSGFFVAWLSQYWARTHHPRWFARRNYVLASAFDAGTSVNALFIFVLSMTVLKRWPIQHWFMNPARDSEHCSPSS